MGITPDQISTFAQVASAATLTTSWAVNPQAGSKVIVFVECSVQPTSVVDNGTTPATFTLDHGTALGKGVWIYRADNITLPSAGAYQVTVNEAAAHAIQAIGRSYLGVKTGGPASTNIGNATSTDPNSGSVTDSLVCLYFGGFSDASGLNPETITFNSSATFTERARNTNGSSFWPMAMADAITTGSQSLSWTLGDSVAWAAAIVVYEPLPPAYRSLDNTTWANRTNTVLNKPAGTVDGDVLLIFFLANATGISPPAGFAALPGFPYHAISGLSTYAWYKVASGEPATYTITHGALTTQGTIAAIQRADTTAPFTPNPTLNDGGDGISTALGLTTARNDSLVLYVAWNWGDTANDLVPPTGSTPTFTERLDVTISYLADGLLAAADATGDKTQVNNSGVGSPWAAFLFAIQSPGIPVLPSSVGLFTSVGHPGPKQF